MSSKKRKRPNTPQVEPPVGGNTTTAAAGLLLFDLETGQDSNAPSPAPSAADSDAGPVAQKQFIFKDPNFTNVSKLVQVSKKSRGWKSLKRICLAQRAAQYKPDEAIYSGIDAPPSFKPAKKYSDLSGLPAHYTDPQTKLRYANAEEYARVQLLPTDIVTGLLLLRKANPAVP